MKTRQEILEQVEAISIPEVHDPESPLNGVQDALSQIKDVLRELARVAHRPPRRRIAPSTYDEDDRGGY